MQPPVMLRLALVATATLTLVPALPAQITGALDAGSGTMRVGSESPSGILRLAPSLQFRTPALRLALSGDYAGHMESGWQTTGKAQAAFRRPLGSFLELSLGAEAGWSRTRWGRSAAGWMAEGRAQLGTTSRGLSLALGSGHSFIPGGTQPLSRMEAGGWGRLGRVNLGFWLKRTGLTAPNDESSVNPRDTLEIGAGQRSLQDHYTDAEATVGWNRGNLGLEAGAGRRFGRAVRFTSWYVRGLYQLTSRVSLVATSGRFPVDVISGLPSGSFTTVSMRFNLRADSERAGAKASRGPRASGLFEARRDERGRHLIAVWVPDAGSVEMMGSFTDWKPVTLVPGDNDLWLLRISLEPGIHEVNIRANGKAWSVPPGLTSVDDGLGGRVGVFVVE